MKFKVIISILFLTLLSSCDLNTVRVKATVSDKDRIKSDMFYFQDKLGLCYAGITYMTYSGMWNVSITNIPCDIPSSNEEIKTNS